MAQQDLLGTDLVSCLLRRRGRGGEGWTDGAGLLKDIGDQLSGLSKQTLGFGEPSVTPHLRFDCADSVVDQSLRVDHEIDASAPREFADARNFPWLNVGASSPNEDIKPEQARRA